MKLFVDCAGQGLQERAACAAAMTAAMGSARMWQLKGRRNTLRKTAPPPRRRYPPAAHQAPGLRGGLTARFRFPLNTWSFYKQTKLYQMRHLPRQPSALGPMPPATAAAAPQPPVRVSSRRRAVAAPSPRRRRAAAAPPCRRRGSSHAPVGVRVRSSRLSGCSSTPIPREAPQRRLHLDTKKRTAPPCSRAARRNRALRHQFGRERLVWPYSRPFCGAPPTLNIGCASWRFHLSPAQRKKVLNGCSGGPFQAEGAD